MRFTTQGGVAISNGLFGKHAFGGRLPYTIYRASFVNETKMSQMDLTKDCGRTCAVPTPVCANGVWLCGAVAVAVVICGGLWWIVW